MNDYFGTSAAATFAQDRVLSELGNRTVEEALAAGEPAKDVWRAVCAAAEIPARAR